jgi:hypothetical protein
MKYVISEQMVVDMNLIGSPKQGITCMVNFPPRPLYRLGKSPRYPLDRRPGEPQNRPGRCGEKKTFYPLPGIDLSHPAHNQSLY